MYEIKVFPDKALGPIRDLHGVGGGPVTNHFVYDATEDFRVAGIPFCRTHDIEYPFGLGEFVDIHCIFKDFNKDENDPASYNFTFTDEYLKAIQNPGAQTFYRDRVVGKKLEESLLRFRSGPAAGGVLDDYNEDRITYEQAEGEMKLLQQLEFPANGVAPHLKDLAGLKDSKAAYALAVDADQKGDYAQAMAGYANVSSIDRHYKEAEEKAETMAKQYKEDILAQAGNPQNEQDYARAIKILTAAQKILPKDQDFSDTLVTLKQGYSAAVKQQVVAVAKDYISKGYYKQVIDMVGKALTYSSNDLELQTLLTTATNNYEDFAKDQVEIYLGNRDYAGAMALLERVKRDLPDDAVIGQLYETTKSQADLYR